TSAAKGLGEDLRIRLARSRLLARQQPVEIAPEPRELAEMLELVLVDVADDTEAEAAAAELGERFGYAPSQTEVATRELPLPAAVALEVVGIRLGSELAQHLDDGIAKHVAMEVEAALEVSSEHAP